MDFSIRGEFYFQYSRDEGQMVEQPDHEIWVRNGDRVNRLAEKIVEEIEDRIFIDLACIGAACVNQATKAVAVARNKIEEEDNYNSLFVVPGFSTIIDDEGKEKTRIVLRVVWYRADQV